MTPTDEEKMFAAIAHASGIAVTGFGPLVVWLLKKDGSPFIAYHAIQAMIYHFVAIAVFSIFTSITCGFGAVLLPLVWLIPLFWAYKAYGGSTDGYPLISGVGRPAELP